MVGVRVKGTFGLSPLRFLDWTSLAATIAPRTGQTPPSGHGGSAARRILRRRRAWLDRREGADHCHMKETNA